jgi:hypothetical protein
VRQKFLGQIDFVRSHNVLSLQQPTAYLSRFCEVRYCIARHCAFLLGYGHSSGDPHVAVQSIDQVVRLLRRPTPWQENLDEIFRALDGLPAQTAWPEPETPAEWMVLSAATLLFTEPSRAERARRSLGRLLGGRSFQYLVGLLAFIKMAHFWTLAHPEIELEDDVLDLLRRNEELQRALLDDPESGRCSMGIGLFTELETLRALNEKHELERANRELQRRFEERDLLFKEANHRLKNSLQIISSTIHLQLPTVKDAAAVQALHNTEARVMAIAAAHERLYKDNDIGAAFVENLAVGKFHGIGPVTAEKMNLLGIQTGADLRSKSAEFLSAHFGKAGPWYYAISRGEDDRPVNANRQRKSSGSETTFAEDLTDAGAIEHEVLGQADEVWAWCQKANAFGRTVTVKIKYADFQQATRSRSLTTPVSSQAVLHEICLGLIRSVLPTRKGIRLVGVSISNFEHTASSQLDFAI